MVVTIDTKTIIILLVVFLLGCASGWYMSGGGFDSSGGTEYQTIVSELDKARRDNENLTAELNRSAAIIASNNSRITSLQERVGRAEASASTAYGLLQQNDSLLKEAERISGEDKRLLRSILERSKEENKKP